MCQNGAIGAVFFTQQSSDDVVSVPGLSNMASDSANLPLFSGRTDYTLCNYPPSRMHVIAGDFNSNAIWDRKGRCWSHSEVVKQLEGMGLRSLYHSKYGETPGKEATPTLYLQKNPDKPYHIDFVFLSECMVPKSSIKIGKRDNWLKVSDHMPVIAELTS